MDERIFDVWTLQEIFHSLPEIKLHEWNIRKNSFKEISKTVCLKEWHTITKKRTTPIQTWNNFEKRLRHYGVNPSNQSQLRGKEFIIKCYVNVLHPGEFIKMLSEMIIPTTDEGILEELKNANIAPVFLFSFFTNINGTAIYGLSELNFPRNKEAQQELKLRFRTLDFHPVWWYIESICSNKPFPALHEILRQLNHIEERFNDRFVSFENFLFTDCVVDTSFLIRYASMPQNPLELLGNPVYASSVNKGELLKIRFYIPHKVIHELECHKKGQGEKANRAKQALAYLIDFKQKHPDYITIEEKEPEGKLTSKLKERYGFSDTDACVVATALNLQNQKRSPNTVLILTTDYGIINAAIDCKIAVANRGIPVKLQLYQKNRQEAFKALVDEILEWFYEFAGLQNLKDKIESKKPVRTLCDLTSIPKNDNLVNDFLPSFFIDPINICKKLYEEGQIKGVLKSYLEGNPETRNVSEYVDLLVSPQLIPNAAWPSPPGRYPFFSQYLAISAANYHLLQKGESQIIAVNGPPGTGKTTLLKEIVANHVVKLATIIAQDNPKLKKKELQNIDLSGVYYLGFEKFADWGIVVASANNNAVLNVSKELPLAENNKVISKNNKLIQELFKEQRIQFIWDKMKKIQSYCLVQGEEKQEKENLPECVFNISATLGSSKRTRPFMRALVAALDKLKRKTPKDFRDEMEKEAKNAIMEFKEYLSDISSLRKELLFIKKCDIQKQKAQKMLETNKEKLTTAKSEWKIHEGEITSLKQKINEIETQIKETQVSLEGKQLSLVKIQHEKKEFLNFKNKLIITLSKLFRKDTKALKNFNRLLFIEQELVKEKKNDEDRITTLTNLKEKTNLLLKQHIENPSYLNLKQKIPLLERKHTKIRKAIELLEKKHKEICAKWGIQDDQKLSSPYLTNQNPNYIERTQPWGIEKIKILRERVFLAAYKVLLCFTICNIGAVNANIKMLNNILAGQRSSNGNEQQSDNTDFLRTLWGTLFLLFPVVSTTFHSSYTLFKNFLRPSAPKEPPLGTLVIDEAGQGVSYMPLTLLLLNKRAIIVGDPLQLEPVVTIPPEIMKCILKDIDKHSYFYISGVKGVSFGDICLDSSVQILADRASIYHGIIPIGDSGIQTGIPLKIHFRCKPRIMEIANEVAYGGMMLHIQPDDVEEKGIVKWLDVKSKPYDWIENFSKAEAKKVEQLLKKLNMGKEKIYIISPFKSIKNIDRYAKGVNIRSENIGTVHTFQGKEAPVVIFVLGGRTPGVRAWAASSPNLINVAVTRAKEELYVVGDVEKWGNLPFFSILAKTADKVSL